MVYVYSLIIFLVAAMVQGAIGFGAGPVVLAFMPLFVPYEKAIAINIFEFIWATIFLSFKNRKYIPWKVLCPILIPSVILAALSAYWSLSVDSSIMFLLLGFVLIILAIWFFAFDDRVKIKPTIASGTVMGFLTGIMSGLFAIGGPTAALYLMPAIDSKEGYFAAIQCIFAICNVFTLSIRIANHSLQFSDIQLLAVCFVAVVLGSALGRAIFKKINQSTFKKVIYFFIGINGLWIVISNFIK